MYRMGGYELTKNCLGIIKVQILHYYITTGYLNSIPNPNVFVIYCYVLNKICRYWCYYNRLVQILMIWYAFSPSLPLPNCSMMLVTMSIFISYWPWISQMHPSSSNSYIHLLFWRRCFQLYNRLKVSQVNMPPKKVLALIF